MKKKKFLALALALSIVAGAVGTTSFVSLAAPYTKDASQVEYGTLTDKELDMIYQYFDEGFYAAKYADVAAAFGTDRASLLQHFINCGIFEGREGWPKYRPDDFESVEDVTADFVPVEIYEAASLIGTNDYDTIQEAADSAVDNGASVVSSDENTYVVVDEEVAKQLAKDNPNYDKLGTFSVSGDRECVIFVYKKDGQYCTKLLLDIENDFFSSNVECTDIVGLIPAVLHKVEVANMLCEAWGIEKFEVNEGVVVGTEGLTLTIDDQEVYHAPTEFEAPYQRNMTNFLNGGYVNNAYSGIDVEGTDTTEYEIGSITEADDNGNVNVTAVISNEETGFNYEITYTFDGNPYAKEEVAEDTAAEAAEETVETVEESVEE